MLNRRSVQRLTQIEVILELNIPRDRNSAFESRILPKHQRDISEIEDNAGLQHLTFLLK